MQGMDQTLKRPPHHTLWVSEDPVAWSEKLLMYPDAIRGHKTGLTAMDKYAGHCVHSLMKRLQ